MGKGAEPEEAQKDTSSKMSSKTKFVDVREDSWPAGLYRRESSFRYRRMLQGKILRDVWGDIPIEDAIRKAHRYNLDVEEGHNPITKAKRNSTTFEQFAKGWLAQKTTALRRKSVTRYREIIEHFQKFLDAGMGEEASMTVITEADVWAYVTHRKQANVMPNGHESLSQAARVGAAKKTIHVEIEMLRQLFGEAVNQRLLSINPFSKVKVPKPKTNEIAAKHHPLSEAEEKAFLKAVTEMDKERKCQDDARCFDVFLFLLKTGLRENEVRYLEWSDVDWDRGLIHIREKNVVETRTVLIPPSVTDRVKRLIAGREPTDLLLRDDENVSEFTGVLFIREQDALRSIKVGDVDLENQRITTTRRFRWSPKATQGDVPMCKTVAKMLARLMKSKTSNFVFAHRDGGSCRLQLWEMVKEAQKRAEIPGNLRLHDLRHSFAVRLRKRKVPLEVIMGLMRHSSLKETLIYAPYNLDEGIQAINVLDK